jgi:hypothetical protein
MHEQRGLQEPIVAVEYAAAIDNEASALQMHDEKAEHALRLISAPC